ncbi:EamA family transporter [Streptomyces sp. AN091965]|uniref:EamA family transporter n=1 Tax=Streptomyces sp. AN091965 TaxID=2927803 RepID=UPI001F612AA9|nr:EamA family transporter [Streptomyces sp. AN091965]MCI3933004.1 EamA family transporter [Streptomyces sp. AN091965]
MGNTRAARGALGLVLAQVVSLQAGAAVAKAAYGQVSPTALAGMRLGFAALVLGCVVRPRPRRFTAERWWAAMGLGVVLAAMNTVYFQAIGKLPLGVAATLELLGPLLLALALSRGPAQLCAGLLALVGVLLLAVPGGALPVAGLALGALAAGCRAAYVVLNRRVGRLFPDWSGLTVALAVGALLLVPVAVFSDGAAVARHPGVLATGLLVALLSSLIPYSLDLLALRRIDVRAFGVLLALGPAAGAAVGFAALGERLNARQCGAVALVVVACAWAVWSGDGGRTTRGEGRATKVGGRPAKSEGRTTEAGGRAATGEGRAEAGRRPAKSEGRATGTGGRSGRSEGRGAQE